MKRYINSFSLMLIARLMTMAVIWRKKSGFKVYVTPSGQPPTQEEIELAKEYDKELQERVHEVTLSLREKGFFEMQHKMKKWHMLGKELQFLDNMDLRSKCDPHMENTWKAFYDLAPHLAPTKRVPTDKQRVVGRRNHFYVCYLLGKMPWNQVKNLTWANWNDIYMAFSLDMWKDGSRLLKWVIDKSSIGGKITRRRLRLALKGLRRAVGQRAKIPKDTTVLSNGELTELLNRTFEMLVRSGN